MSRFTIIVKDNAKLDNVVELEVDTVHYNISGEGIRMVGSFPDNSEEVTEKIIDCSKGHSYITYESFSRTVAYCEHCGEKQD